METIIVSGRKAKVTNGKLLVKRRKLGISAFNGSVYQKKNVIDQLFDIQNYLGDHDAASAVLMFGSFEQSLRFQSPFIDLTNQKYIVFTLAEPLGDHCIRDLRLVFQIPISLRFSGNGNFADNTTVQIRTLDQRLQIDANTPTIVPSSTELVRYEGVDQKWILHAVAGGYTIEKINLGQGSDNYLFVENNALILSSTATVFTFEQDGPEEENIFYIKSSSGYVQTTLVSYNNGSTLGVGGSSGPYFNIDTGVI